MKIKELIMEVYYSMFNEDVGDKYLKRKYNMKGEFDDFETKYKKSLSSKEYETIHSENNWSLYKNPNSLNNLGEKVRGVILSNGDLYIESGSGEKIHNDILNILFDKGIINEKPKKNWGKKTPQESGFLTVQRYKSSPYIAIGESNRYIYDDDVYDKYKNYYQKYLDLAKTKNPNIKFINKLVGTKLITKTTGDNVMSESYF